MPLLLAVVLVVLTACSGPFPQSALAPRSDFSTSLDHLFTNIFWWAVVVFLIVEALLLYAIGRYRARAGAAAPKPVHGHTALEIGWTLAPALILVFIAVPTMRTIFETAGNAPEGALRVEVIGHQWWWEYRYPTLGIGAANELHVPLRTPVQLEMTSADVIHSFWVPELQTKIDQIPGHTNELWLQADKQGRYRGQCSQFCGLQHAHMIFFVVADPPALFQAWESGQAAPAAAPMSPAAAGGLAVFTSNTCAGCHAIRGTSAAATVGPDLTHVAGRATIASGTIDNTPANLAHWITDPQEVKPGAIMPPTQLSPTDLQDLVAYLQSLP